MINKFTKNCLFMIIKVDFLYSATNNKNLHESGFFIKLINRLLLRVKFLMSDNRCFFRKTVCFSEGVNGFVL